MILSRLVALFKKGNIPFNGIFSVDYFLNNYVKLNVTSNYFIVLNKNNHWFGLVFHPNYTLTYIDSLGKPLLDWDWGFSNILADYTVTTLPFRLQSDHSNTCAYYIFYYFQKIKQGKSIATSSAPFTRHSLSQNDIYITNWIQRWMV